jgi:hypothetical protein
MIILSLLSRIGTFLHSNINYRETRECIDLSLSTQDAVNGICSSVASYLGSEIEESPNTGQTEEVGPFQLFYALLVMWPLYCASKARGIAPNQRDCIKNMLWRIGVKTLIPKAMSLVRRLSFSCSER